MVIVAIKGGLGNQLFQYSFAKYLKLKFNTNICIDVSHFSEYDPNTTPRHFLLNKIDNDIEFAPSQLTKNFITANDHFPKKIYKKLIRTLKNQHYYEEPLENLPEIHLNKTYYFNGYWQLKKYAFYILDGLNAHTETILKGNSDYRSILASTQACAIHIRRGDYVTNEFTNSIHGNCDIGYFNKAMITLENKISIDQYFIFSDDQEWAKESFSHKTNIHFINGNIDNPIIDLFLMKSCKHQIISNSSFSCWATYLNTYKEKIIIAPAYWTKTMKTEHTKLTDPSWLLI